MLALTRCALGVLGVLVVFSSPAAADEEDVPAGKFGLFGGVRQNVGDLRDDYGWGYLIGLDAHYHPMRPGQSLSLGFAWSTAFGRFGADDPSIADSPMRSVEMSLGLRLRKSLGETAPRYLVLSGGGTLLRTNVPVAPEMERVYVGGYAALGYEEYMFGRQLIAVDARYGLFGDAPGSVSLTVGIGFSDRANKQIAFGSLAIFLIGALLMQL